MTKEDKEKIIRDINALLTKQYLFPLVAEKIITVLDEKFKNDLYDNINDPLEFSNIITKDLQSINNDLHLNLKYDPDNKIGRLKPNLKNRIKISRKENFGFEKIEILKGNIGYLKVNKFENPIFAGDTLTSTMNFLGNTDALIIDIMNNPGGNIPMGELIASYFFNDRIHLSSFDFREYDITHHTYTSPYVYGQQYLNKDLYILISKKSASGAEGFAYELKHLKRAIIIGEQSAGAAHSGSYKNIGNFKVYIPTGRPINPNTKTNWEGVGVIPHIKISKRDAITTAHLLALKKLYSGSKDDIYSQELKSNMDIKTKINNWIKNEKTANTT